MRELNGARKMKSLSGIGTWWLPDAGDRKVAGTISANSDGTVLLSLTEPFEDGSASSMAIPTRYPVILGDTRDGKEITLLEVYVTSRASHAMSYGRVTERGPELRAHRAFIGAHLPLGDETPVSSVKLVFSHLADWVCGDQPFASEELSEDMLRRHVEYSYPTPIDFRGLDGTILIATESGWSTSSHSETVRRQPYLRVNFDKPVAYKDIHDKVVKPFQCFLTFACGAPADLEELSFWVDDIGYQHGDRRSPRDISQTLSERDGDRSARPHSWEFLLPLASIRGRVEEIFSKWLKILENASAAVDFYGSIFLGPQLYLETRFLYAAQALEVYHRRCPWFDNKSMPTDEWRKRWNNLEEMAHPHDPALVNWVGEMKAVVRNEKNLRKCLEDLVEHGNGQAQRILRPDFVDLATKTRHKLTHHDPKASGAEAEDIFWLAEEAIGLLESCILRDLGLTPTEIKKATSRTQRTKNLVARRK